MNCPNDNATMHPVRSATHYGQLLIVNQCPQCGGIWFDEGELFRAEKNQSEKIELFNQDALLASTPVLNILVCPRDKTPLHTLSDTTFPKELIIESCKSCHGIWMNRGEFSQYQDIRQESEKPQEKTPDDIAFDKKIDALLAAESTSNENIDRIAKFYSMQMDPFTGEPVDDEKQAQFREAKNNVNRIIRIVFTLLRFFLRR